MCECVESLCTYVLERERERERERKDGEREKERKRSRWMDRQVGVAIDTDECVDTWEMMLEVSPGIS